MISYGSRAETTYRKVNLKSTTDPNYIVTRINGVSGLITVAVGAGALPQTFTAIGQAPLQYASTVQSNWTTFAEIDFTNVFQEDTPLDKVSIFNLLLVPGVADSGIWGEALKSSVKGNLPS